MPMPMQINLEDADQILDRMRHSCRVARATGEDVEGPPHQIEVVLDLVEMLRRQNLMYLQELRDEQTRLGDTSIELEQHRLILRNARDTASSLSAAHDDKLNQAGAWMKSALEVG